MQQEVRVSEGLLVGIFWNNPEQYNFFPKDKIHTDTFLNKVYGFYFGLGRYMYEEKGIKYFDELSVAQAITELGLEDKYKYYGEYETIEELMIASKDLFDNLDGYYQEIKKYNLLKNLVDLFGEKVLAETDKYNYKKMNKNQIHLYWHDRVNRLAMDGDNKYDEHHLLANLEQEIEKWDKNPSIGLPFYQSRLMTNICTGWDYGNLYIFGGFGGSGKTSFTFNKIIMSCIEHKEKLLIIANEQSITEFRKMLIVTAMGVGTKRSINRQRLNQGNFTEKEKEKLIAAKNWIKSICDDDKLITFVFMEDYIMEDVKKIILHYSNRGYKRVIIDTGKPSDGDYSMPRWERFTEDFKELYKLARENGGGLNLAIWVNVQLADSALNRRFLNEHALGESKKIKNEASVMFMGRTVWDDEYDGEKNALTVYKFKKDTLNGYGYERVEFKLNKEDAPYYLLFTPKNRRGQDNKTGLDVLVMKPNFNNNTWEEIGFTKIIDDRSF